MFCCFMRLMFLKFCWQGEFIYIAHFIHYGNSECFLHREGLKNSQNKSNKNVNIYINELKEICDRVIK